MVESGCRGDAVGKERHKSGTRHTLATLEKRKIAASNELKKRRAPVKKKFPIEPPDQSNELAALRRISWLNCSKNARIDSLYGSVIPCQS